MEGLSKHPPLTLHTDENVHSSMEGHGGSMEGKSHTLHRPQSHTGQDVQPSQISNMEGMEGKNENLRAKEKIINSDPDNLPLTQQILHAWDSPPILGKIVLEANPAELRFEAQYYEPEQIAILKDAANQIWMPGLNRDAEYNGERVQIIDASNKTRDIIIQCKSGTKIKVKRGNLKPWLGI